jgi:uncharacterized protein YcbK (DUF882 family)
MWTYFTRDEFKCKGQNCCDGSNKMDDAFITKLDELRRGVAAPLVPSSGYRCPIHNQRVSKTGPNGPHTTGRAVDLAVHGALALTVLDEALALYRFTGFGIKQHGPRESRFIHLDDLALPNHPRPNIWTY